MREIVAKISFHSFHKLKLESQLNTAEISPDILQSKLTQHVFWYHYISTHFGDKLYEKKGEPYL